MKKKSFCATTWNRLLEHSKKHGLLKRGDGVIAAVSGGPDSVCLLHFLREMSRKTGFELIACHINHGIRKKTAQRDENFTKDLCLKLGIRFVSHKNDVPAFAKKHRISLEHAARKIRYKLLEKTAQRHKCNKIAAGHHLDDHVETMLINLLRGTNPKGLLGIPVKRKTEGGLAVIRPLLCITRAEVLEYLRQHNLDYCTDETNESEKFTRNWIRKTLLPMLETKQPRFRAHLLELSQKLSELIG